MPSRITSLDLGNGGEYYGSYKQVLNQSNGSTLDFKRTSTKVSSSQPLANNSSDDSSKGDPSQGKSRLLKIMVLGKINQQIRLISKTFQ